jgi:DNA transformation protein and related proteins
MAVSKEFADYCCDLLAGVGPCVAKRMFGGWGVSVDGMSIAWLLDLGKGDKLWLKANAETAAQFRAAGCEQFQYEAKGQVKSVNYFAAPEEAMESAPLMLPWARLALQAALVAQASKAAKVTKVAKAAKVAPASKTRKAPKKTLPAKAPAKPQSAQKGKPGK